MADAVMSILLRAKDESSAIMAQVQKATKQTAKDTMAMRIEFLQAAENAQKLAQKAQTAGTELAHLKAAAAAQEVKQLEQNMGSAASKTNGFTSGLKGLAIAAAGAFAAMQVKNQIMESVDATAELGLAVNKLSRETGLSVEQASRYSFILHHLGMDVGSASTAFGIFSKGLLGIQDIESGAIAGGKKTADVLAELGIAAYNSNGQIRPMADLIPELSDKFKTLADGPAKTALAMQLFGRSGKDMIPFLNLGSQGMADLAAEADKLGLTLSGSNVDDIKKYVFAHRDMEAAIEGVRVRIGLALMPVLTALSMWFTSHQADVMAFASGMRDQVASAFEHLQQVVDALMPALQPFIDFVQNNPKDLQAITIALGVATVGMLAFAAASALAALVNPFTLTVAGIAVLIAAITILVRHWDEVWTAMMAAPQALLNWFSGGGWKDVLIGAVTGPLGIIMHHWDAVFDALPAPVQNAINAVLGVFSSLVNHVIDVVNQVIRVFNMVAQPILIIVAILLGPLVVAIAAVVIAVKFLYDNWNTIWAAMTTVVAAVINWLQSAWSKTVDIVTALWSGLSDAWSTVWDNLGGPVKAAFDVVGGIVETAINKIIDLINDLIGKIGSVTGAFGGILKHFHIDVPEIKPLDHVSFGVSPGGGELGPGPQFQKQADQNNKAFQHYFETLRKNADDAAVGVDGLNLALGGGGGSGGLSDAEKAAQQDLIDMALAYADFHAATGKGIDDFLALIKMSQDKDALDKQMTQTTIDYKAAVLEANDATYQGMMVFQRYATDRLDLENRMAAAAVQTKVNEIEAADAGFQLQKALVGIAEDAAKAGRTIAQESAKLWQGVVSGIQSAFSALNGGQTKEGAQRQLAIDRAQLAYDEAKRHGASQKELDALQKRIDNLNDAAKIADDRNRIEKDLFDVANQTLPTEQEKLFREELYIIAQKNATTTLDQVTAIATLQAIAQANYIDALNSAATALGGADTWTAAMKHWVNGVASSKGEPDPFPGFATGIDRVPHDMLAFIHKDERIIPAVQNLAYINGLSGGSFAPGVPALSSRAEAPYVTSASHSTVVNNSHVHHINVEVHAAGSIASSDRIELVREIREEFDRLAVEADARGWTGMTGGGAHN